MTINLGIQDKLYCYVVSTWDLKSHSASSLCLSASGFFQNKYDDDSEFQDSGGMLGRITRARKLMSQKQYLPSAIK